MKWNGELKTFTKGEEMIEAVANYASDSYVPLLQQYSITAVLVREAIFWNFHFQLGEN